MINSFLKVFKNYRYVLTALFSTFVVFLFSVWLPNIPLIIETFNSNYFSFATKFSVLFNLTGSIKTNFTAFSATYTIIISILFGINLAMVFYYYHLVKSANLKAAGGTAGGLIAGILGIGCASCGSLIITVLLGSFAGPFLSFLPFGGEEFGVLAIIILLWSLFLISKKINSPLICEPDQTTRV